MSKESHWKAPWDFNPEEFVGFTYLITCRPNGRKYIGKKLFTSTTRKKVSGHKNRKKITKPSNWKTYSGSSKWLLSDIKIYGESNFDFVILSLHESKSTLAWAEATYIVRMNALQEVFPNGEKAFYNGILCPVKFTVLPETEKEKQFKTVIP